jgi:CDP-diacylglycerol--serine O-phosphatidyltransferase
MGRMSAAARSGKGRGVYLLPSLMTTAALFSGFFAIIKALEGAPLPAAVAVLVAMVFDGLDGRLARLIHAETDFGAEFDSISDTVSFGVAPAVLVYVWALQPFGNLGWLGAFMFTACSGLRLARFNTQSAAPDKRYFQGLPTPAAAATLASWVLLAETAGVSGLWMQVAVLVAVVGLGLLMVSNVRYRSFKDVDVKRRVPFPVAVVMVAGLILVAAHPPLVLFVFFLGFAVYGPIATGLQRRWRWQEKRRASRGGTGGAGLDSDSRED